MSESKANAWLCRDSGLNMNYKLFAPHKPELDLDGHWKCEQCHGCIWLGYDNAALRSIVLMPGEGPVPVRITIERADNP